MKKSKLPVTQAIRELKAHKAVFSLHPYRYQEKGGTAVAARELDVDEHAVIKTLVMEEENGAPFLVLMHGDKKVSLKGLARTLGIKAVRPCDPDAAHRHTGYFVGGISPFGTRKSMDVCIEESILHLPRVYINAGKRGLMAAISPRELTQILKTVPITVAID
jgi:Cys-tRNA(Pro) deacylase